jgi:hypothetical protein
MMIRIKNVHECEQSGGQGWVQEPYYFEDSVSVSASASVMIVEYTSFLKPRSTKMYFSCFFKNFQGVFANEESSKIV